MLRRLFAAAGIIFLWCIAPTSWAASIDLQQWQPQYGDEFIVDVDANVGYLVHADGNYLPFLLATGMRKTIRGFGIVYNGATPTRTWVVKSETMNSGFGVTGRFLRLSYNGKDTHYGIHSYAYVNSWLQSDNRYRSLGCIVVSEDMLNVLEQTYETNGNELVVTTSNGPQALVQELTARDRSAENE